MDFKELLKDYAKESNYDSKLVYSLVMFYWSKISSNLNNFKHQRINVLGFGTFEVRWNRLRDRLETMERRLSKFKTYDSDIYKRYYNELVQLYRLQEAQFEEIEYTERKKIDQLKYYNNAVDENGNKIEKFHTGLFKEKSFYKYKGFLYRTEIKYKLEQEKKKKK